MNKKICIAVAMLLMCTSALLILPKEPNVGAISTEKIIFCFDSYDPDEAWMINPEGMLCDGYGYASTTIDGDVQLLNGNTCTGDRPGGTIIKVELRIRGWYFFMGDYRDIILRPVFRSGDGNNHAFITITTVPSWSPWFDITRDPYAPGTWNWTDVTDLDCDVEAENNPFGGWFILFGSRVQIRVTYRT